MDNEIIKLIAFLGFGISIGQIWVHFALKDFERDWNGTGD